MATRYWLMKSEPSVFSIDDLRRVGVTGWDGVRNYEARNFMQSMKIGDRALFYHSNSEPPGVAGIAEVAREAYPDPTQFDPTDSHFDPKATAENPRWQQVDLRFVQAFAQVIPLATLRSTRALKSMSLFTRSRLSIHPLSKREWDTILGLTGE